MFSNRGSSLVSTILAVAAAGGVGVAGYYLVSGGCGSCSTEAAAVTPVAATTPEVKDGMSCCPSDAEAANAVVVANEAEACDAECTDAEMAACATECTDEMKAACETECSGEAGVELVANESAEACTDAEKAACESSCSGEGAAETVANETGEACTGEAKEACEGEAKVCPVTGQPIADAGN